MELYLELERPQRNRLNGQFLPGHTSLTKGRKRTDFMSAATDRRLKELGAKIFREQKHPKGAGVPRRPIVAVKDNGEWFPFPSACEAGAAIGIAPYNIGRCCRQNEARRVKSRTWTNNRVKGGKGTSKADGSLINTDHRYKGFRWYFDSDPIWIEKIAKT